MSQPNTENPVNKFENLEVHRPTLLAEVIKQAGPAVEAVCGGKGTCGKCKVKAWGELGPLTDKENKILTGTEIREGFRLACQAMASGTVSFELPARDNLGRMRLQVEGKPPEAGYDSGDQPVSPAVKKYTLSLPEATLTDPRGDLERIAGALKEQYGVQLSLVDYRVIREISPAVRQVPWQVTVAVNSEHAGPGLPVNRLISCEPGDTSGILAGLAVDLGSTKIAAYLVDLASGKTLASEGLANPQINYGADIRSRLEFAAAGPENSRLLQQSLVDALNRLALLLCERVGYRMRDIFDAVVVGNTAMHHLLLGLPVEQLLTSPFVPGTTSPLSVRFSDIDLRFATGGYVYLPSPVAGYVGADHLAMIIGGDIHNFTGNCLGVDIGTNTEIVLRTPGAMYTCSCASGPAFEGGHLKFGTRARPGAVESVSIDHHTLSVKAKTIGGETVSGICGSGVITAIAELIRAGVVDGRGRFNGDCPGVRRGEDGYWEFLLVPAEQTSFGKDLTISQRDIGEIKLAAAAIRAGVDILLEEACLSPAELDAVYLAGAFGSHINPTGAMQLGMFPSIARDRFVQLGNAAGMGARKILLSGEMRQTAGELAGELKYIELATHSSFHRFFARALRA